MPQDLPPEARKIARRPAAARFAAGFASTVVLWSAFASAAEPPDESVQRGEYVFHAAGCYGCHTDVKNKGDALAGGAALATPFGDFYGPNITPDETHGLGGWSLADFRRALRQGRSPAGDAYYPVFPYPAYAGMTDTDSADLWAYLSSIASVERADTPHAVGFPFNMRWLANGFWRMLYFAPGAFDPGDAPDGVKDGEVWRRGAYLVNVLGHCGECHSPRGGLGAIDARRKLAGNQDGPEGDPVPNITPHENTGIGDWSVDDIAFYLDIGMDPDGDFAGGAMADVIKHSTARLTPEDRRAVAVYLKSVPAIDNKIAPKPK